MRALGWNLDLRMWRIFAAALVLMQGVWTNLANAGANPLPSCWSALSDLPEKRLVCTHEAWLTDDERAEVVHLTRGYFKDARCTVHVDVDAVLISEALVASDRIVDIPPQPVSCALETSGGAMTIGGTFAPHVVIKGGFATQATPGLANITGINSYLAWPVVAYINRAPSITGEMARMINAFREAKSGREPKSGGEARPGRQAQR